MEQAKSSLRAVFCEAAEFADPAERATFLDSACLGDAALRERVERLLAADSNAGEFLRDRNDTTTADWISDKPGDRIGRYRLIERIGRGGGGVVYLAEQEEPMRRRVALKILKLGMDTQSVVARFEAERQALAMMDHPNIAKVLDAGATQTGRPFFVMELVSGLKLSEYCERNQLSMRQRLELFIPVCHAVQHAHQKGIVHRDLKPSNILVTEHEGAAVPKVIDFGIAIATEQGLDEHARLTRVNQFLGTPAYMSPEQVELGGRDIDTRSDIYSLGVILYELLAGQPPFDPKKLANAGLDEMRRIIREVDPPKPSTTITKNLNPASLPSPHPPARERFAAARGDLDWIVMKCLEKDRARRYETANGLAMDIARHLKHEPVVARSPSPIYRFQKVVRRHRVSFAAAGIISVMLVTTVIVSSQLALRATRAEREQSRLRGVAEANAKESRLRLVRRYVAQGNSLMEDGLPLTALPWMIEALALEAGDPQREPDERLRIAQSRVGAPELLLNLAQGKSVQCVALTSDGSRLATGSDDGIVRISDVSSGGDTIANLNLPGSVRRVRFSPDGKSVVAVDVSGRARVWNATIGEPITPLLQAQEFNERSVANVVKEMRPAASFSPDGKTLLLAWCSKSAQLRDSANGNLLREFPHDSVVYQAAFSPDGRWVVTSSGDGTARVWEAATGKLAGPVLQQPGMVAWAQFSLDGNKLLTVRDRHIVQLWDWRTGRPLAPEIPRRSQLSHASLSPDGSNVFTVAWSGYAHIYDADSSRLINQFEHQGGLVDASFSPNGHSVAIACHDGNVWVWGVDDIARRPMLLPEGNQIEEIAFSGDGRMLAVGTRGGRARVWELSPPERGVRRLPGNDVQWVEFGASGRRALVVNTGTPHDLRVYDVQTARLISSATLASDAASRASFSPDGRRILAFGSGRRVLLFDAESGKYLRDLKHSQRVRGALWSPDGKIIFTEAGSGGARSWDAETGKVGVSFPHSNSVRAMALSPDGTRLAAGHTDRSVKIWQTETGRPEGAPFLARERIRGLRFSPDGRTLAVSSYASGGEGILEVRDLTSGEVVGQPLRHRDEVTSIEFSPDGRWIATACDDHTARVWNAATGEPISPWLPQDYEARRVVFSPDGARLATLARRGASRLWNASTGEAITAPIIYPRNTGDGCLSYSPDGLRLLISRGGNGAFLRELQPDTTSLQELRLQAEVVSCTRFEPAAGMVPLDEAGLNDAWKQLRALRSRK